MLAGIDFGRRTGSPGFDDVEPGFSQQASDDEDAEQHVGGVGEQAGLNHQCDEEDRGDREEPAHDGFTCATRS